jgi:hypothetical protein
MDREAKEVRKLEAAGWEQRGSGPKSIWRRPEGGRWWPHYQRPHRAAWGKVHLRGVARCVGRGRVVRGGPG